MFFPSNADKLNKCDGDRISICINSMVYLFCYVTC